eukprot:scaffold45660_cov66-Phaeocystis_antarctica.AAC.2
MSVLPKAARWCWHHSITSCLRPRPCRNTLAGAYGCTIVNSRVSRHRDLGATCWDASERRLSALIHIPPVRRGDAIESNFRVAAVYFRVAAVYFRFTGGEPRTYQTANPQLPKACHSRHAPSARAATPAHDHTASPHARASHTPPPALNVLSSGTIQHLCVLLASVMPHMADGASLTPASQTRPCPTQPPYSCLRMTRTPDAHASGPGDRAQDEQPTL